MEPLREGTMFTTVHVWLRMADEFTAYCGITDHYQDILGDILFVELPDINLEIRPGEPIARLESVTDFFTMVSPVSGLITAVNLRLENEPRLINSSPEDDGWIVAIDIKHPRELDSLLDADAYARRFHWRS